MYISNDKINIYLPNKIGTTLDKDAEMFEIFKKDGQRINRNRFLSKLLLGYYYDYVQECQNNAASIKQILEKHGIKNEATDISNELLKSVVLPSPPTRKGKNPLRFSLKPTRETSGLLSTIVQNLTGSDTLSQYLCSILMSYCEKPFNERERIVFKEKFELLKEACQNKTAVSFSTIWNPEVIHNVVPYRVETSKEELYNYLLCAEYNSLTGTQEPRSFRINRISNIHFNSKNSTISDETKLLLEKMSTLGPQYVILKNEEAIIKLTTNGQRLFNRIYLGRPKYDYIEQTQDGYYYHFHCSEDQLLFYFGRFSYGVEVISPSTLRDKMISFHTDAIKPYNTTSK